MAEQKVSPILIGVAGEYFVAAELSNLGYIASVTLRNTKGIDIIATNTPGNSNRTSPPLPPNPRLVAGADTPDTPNPTPSHTPV
jgi:hypothetical protein